MENSRDRDAKRERYTEREWVAVIAPAALNTVFTHTAQMPQFSDKIYSFRHFTSARMFSFTYAH